MKIIKTRSFYFCWNFFCIIFWIIIFKKHTLNKKDMFLWKIKHKRIHIFCHEFKLLEFLWIYILLTVSLIEKKHIVNKKIHVFSKKKNKCVNKKRCFFFWVQARGYRLVSLSCFLNTKFIYIALNIYIYIKKILFG